MATVETITDVVEFRINDDLGDDLFELDESNEVNFQVGRWRDRACITVSTVDDSVCWSMTQEQWEQFKFQVERVFNQQARSNSNGK